MLELPDFNKAFDYENNFYLSCHKNRISKILTQYELFKQTIDLPGSIVEFGVFKGISLIKFLTFREILENSRSRKIYGFDVFGKYPRSNLSTDKKFIKAWELNERHYGSLTGLNKDEMKKKLGEKKIHEFRRSWTTRG